MSASLAVSWLSLQLCGFGVVSPPLSAMLFSKGFPVKVGRGCGTSSSRASFIPNFQRLATEVHQLLALGSWPVATALRASPSAQCLPVLGWLTPWASALVLAARNQAVTTVCSVPQCGGRGGLRGSPD